MELSLRIYPLLVLLTLLGCCYSQDAGSCHLAKTCASCIAVGPNCAWCAQKDFYNVSCDLASNLQLTNCTNIQNPEPHNLEIIKNEPLSNAADTPLGEAVQVRPQVAHLDIRKGETASITMSVRNAEDYPVDMYFLMDLSESMSDDLDTLRRIAVELVEEMQALTRDFRVGYGSYVDKSVIPFSRYDVNGDILLECAPNCGQPYLFRNALSLTNNSRLFEETLRDTTYSNSKDAPEGGFDALLQVAACSDIIGWRDQSRHLVVYLSDAPYHSAGDGRLGGILTPNDGECHVDSGTGYYTIDQPQDYPSVGQLSSLIQDKDIVMMFVVTNENIATYRNLLPFFQGSQIGVLAPNSNNLKSSVKALYAKITSVVTIDVSGPEELEIVVSSYCDNYTLITGAPEALECDRLAEGDTVYFKFDITAEHCLDGQTTSFSVSPVGFSEEMLVTVEVICGCECEETQIKNSMECSYNGSSVCGVCECNEGWYGDECQCSGDSATSGDDRLACMAPGSASICSGRGECICGECVCKKQKDPTQVISGEFCQCDNFNCPLYEGQLCGGPSRGTCVCDPETQQSKCRCTPEYEGDSCNCLTSIDACISPNGLICNSHGTCSCGACQCETDSPFKGSTCFDCATCTGQCEVYRECVQCKAFNSGPLTEEECNMCTVDVIIVDKFPEVEYPYNCSVNHIDNCSIVFIPHFKDGEDSVPVIYVLSNTVCPPGPVAPGVDARWIAVGLAIFIVVLGIIFIILYKCYIMWLDRKEFREWEKEKANAQFSQNENPLYKPASTVHKNPAYGTQFSDIGEQAMPLGEKS